MRYEYIMKYGSLYKGVYNVIFCFYASHEYVWVPIYEWINFFWLLSIKKGLINNSSKNMLYSLIYCKIIWNWLYILIISMSVHTFTVPSKYSSTTFTNLFIGAPCPYSSTHPKTIFFNIVTQDKGQSIPSHMSPTTWVWSQFYMATKANTNTYPLHAIATLPSEGVLLMCQHESVVYSL